MSLDNLLGVSLEKIEPDAASIAKLLAAAKRNLADAHIKKVSAENRFDAAYKAIMQLANAALQANGYRTLTSKPGHHMTMIQTLTQTCGLDSEVGIVLDKLRKQRNVADYSGDVPDWAYGRQVWSGAYVFSLNLENGIKIRDRVTHDENVTKSAYGYYNFDYNRQIRRMLYMDDVLYTISNGMVKANNLGTLEEMKSIELIPEVSITDERDIIPMPL